MIVWHKAAYVLNANPTGIMPNKTRSKTADVSAPSPRGSKNALSGKITFTSGKRPEAQTALARMRELYGDCGPAKAQIVVALGGDGHMLDVLRDRMKDALPVYGMNRGTVGFLLNDYSEQRLLERLTKATPIHIHPLHMRATCTNGKIIERRAINEVSLLRQTAQTALLKVFVDGRERLSELACDGCLVSTPAGSSAYNLSAHGPIIPLGAQLLALTPISAFRPRRWRGALLRHNQVVRFDVIDPELRPVAAVADSQEVRDITSVEISEDTSITLTMLFDPGKALDERILTEQFAP
ncbi:MAG: NAD kinase [Caulobacterales bacterium]